MARQWRGDGRGTAGVHPKRVHRRRASVCKRLVRGIGRNGYGRGLAGERRVGPGRLGEGVARLVVPEGVQVWRGTPNGVAAGDWRHVVGHVGKLIGGVRDGRGGEAPVPVHLFGEEPLLVGGDGETAGRTEGVYSGVVGCGRRAGQATVVHLLLGDHGWRREDSVRRHTCRRGNLRVGLLRQLVQETVPSSQEAAVLEHFCTRGVQLPEVSFAR